MKIFTSLFFCPGLLTLMFKCQAKATPVDGLNNLYADDESIETLQNESDRTDADDYDDVIHDAPTPNDDTVNNSTEDRIIGGFDARPGWYPFAARVFFVQGGVNKVCGGTLLTRIWVLTAAHCIYPQVTSVSVRVGSIDPHNGGQFKTAIRWFAHGGFQLINGFSGSDIGMIKLASPVSLNQFVRPAWIINPNYVPRLGTNVVTTGWGRTSPHGVQSNVLKGSFQTVRTCTLIPPNARDPSRSLVCSLGTDFSRNCKGDSGGFQGYFDFQVNEWVTIGVYAYHFAQPLCNGPTGFMSVSYFNGWIHDIVRNN